MLRANLWLSAMVLGLCACGALVRPVATLPGGVTCGKLFVSGDDLAAQLAGRTSGDCVLLPAGTYRGNFTLPADVSLIGGEGATVVLRGVAAGQPVLTVTGGSKTQIRGLAIDASAGGGIAINPGPVSMSGVTITASNGAGLTATCTETDCSQREVVLDDCVLGGNRLGLWAIGAAVRINRGSVSGSHGTSLTDGMGVVAVNGAAVNLSGVTVENNANVGVLIDGATTRATLDQVAVHANLGRGLWVQGLRGAATLTVTGGTFAGNGLVGLGALDSEGLVVSDLTVTQTVAVPRSPDGVNIEHVGDGVGLFGGTRASSLQRLTLSDSARAQLVIDSGGDALSVTGTASGGLYRAVVQRTTTAVDLPTALVDAAPVLYVDDARLTAP